MRVFITLDINFNLSQICRCAWREDFIRQITANMWEYWHACCYYLVTPSSYRLTYPVVPMGVTATRYNLTGTIVNNTNIPVRTNAVCRHLFFSAREHSATCLRMDGISCISYLLSVRCFWTYRTQFLLHRFAHLDSYNAIHQCACVACMVICYNKRPRSVTAEFITEQIN